MKILSLHDEISKAFTTLKEGPNQPIFISNLTTAQVPYIFSLCEIKPGLHSVHVY